MRSIHYEVYNLIIEKVVVERILSIERLRDHTMGKLVQQIVVLGAARDESKRSKVWFFSLKSGRLIRTQRAPYVVPSDTWTALDDAIRTPPRPLG